MEAKKGSEVCGQTHWGSGGEVLMNGHLLDLILLLLSHPFIVQTLNKTSKTLIKM